MNENDKRKRIARGSAAGKSLTPASITGEVLPKQAAIPQKPIASITNGAYIDSTATRVNGAPLTQPAQPVAQPQAVRQALPSPQPAAQPQQPAARPALPQKPIYVDAQGNAQSQYRRPNNPMSKEGQAWNAQRAAEATGARRPPINRAGGGGISGVVKGITNSAPVGAARSAVNSGVGKGVGVLTAAGALLDNNATTNEQYRERFGLAQNPKDTNFAKEFGIRTLGFASDLGANLPVIGEPISTLYRDKQSRSGYEVGRDAGSDAVGIGAGALAAKYTGKATNALSKMGKKGKLAAGLLTGLGGVMGYTAGSGSASTISDKIKGHASNELSGNAAGSDHQGQGIAQQSTGSGYFVDGQGNRQDYNPQTQMFEGDDIGKKGRGTVSIMEGAGQRHKEGLAKLDAAFSKYSAAGDLEGMRRVADPNNKDHQTAIGMALRTAEPNVHIIGDSRKEGNTQANSVFNEALRAANSIKNPKKKAAALAKLAGEARSLVEGTQQYGLDQQRLNSEEAKNQALINESGLKQQDLGYDLETKRRIAGLMSDLQSAETPEQADAARSAILAIQGKTDTSKVNKLSVDTGEVDELGSPIMTDILVDNSGNIVFGNGAQQNRNTPPPAIEGQVADVFDNASGKMVRMVAKNGEWVRQN